MKIMLAIFNAEVCRDDFSKPTAGNESLLDISNESGVRAVIFATSEKSHSRKYTVPT
jgi:hypothetical protein